MKHFKIKAVCLFAAFAMAALLITGCSQNKTPASTADFKAMAAQKNYIVQDGTDLFAAYDYIKLATITAPQDKSFQIEFYELNNEAFALSFFTSNKNNFIMMKGIDANEYTKTGSNFDIYKLEMYNKFMMIERVGSTVVYVNETDVSNKQTIEKFLSELNY